MHVLVLIWSANHVQPAPSWLAERIKILNLNIELCHENRQCFICDRSSLVTTVFRHENGRQAGLGAQCIVVDNDSSSLYKHLQKSRIFYLFHPLTLFTLVSYIKIICIVFPGFMFGINLNLDLRSSKTLHSQKSHRPVASCWFYRLAASCQQVAGTGLSLPVDNRAEAQNRKVLAEV
jgi:hypothetical protein